MNIDIKRWLLITVLEGIVNVRRRKDTNSYMILRIDVTKKRKSWSRTKRIGDVSSVKNLAVGRTPYDDDSGN